MLSSDDRKYMLNQYFRIIHNISDKQYQNRAWIRGQLPGIDFDETVCQFEDLSDPLLSEYHEFGMTNKQYVILKKFRDEFEVFADNNNWPQLFINTPEWDAIVEMAKEVLRAFHYNPETSE